MSEPIIVCENLVQIFKVAELEVVALQGLDLTIPVSYTHLDVYKRQGLHRRTVRYRSCPG